MIRHLPRLLSPRLVKFVLSGGAAAVANILSRMALSRVMGYSLSIAIAYLIGMTVAYVLMRLFVFEPSGRSHAEEYVRYALVNAVSFLQVWGVSVLLARSVVPAFLPGVDAETPAHVIGVLSTVATSYLLHGHFTFRKATRSPSDADE